jgi:hypothetical protein
VIKNDNKITLSLYSDYSFDFFYHINIWVIGRKLARYDWLVRFSSEITRRYLEIKSMHDFTDRELVKVITFMHDSELQLVLKIDKYTALVLWMNRIIVNYLSKVKWAPLIIKLNSILFITKSPWLKPYSAKMNHGSLYHIFLKQQKSLCLRISQHFTLFQ